ncbi:MAG: glycosyltransferase [Chroococcales cyanobacterium]
MANGEHLPATLDEVSLPQVLPPILLPAFTRSDLLRQVLDGLAQQSLRPPVIIAVVDGPRNEREQALVEETVQLLEDFSAIIPVEIVRRSQNLGCDKNIVTAFNETFQTHESLVYLEDDIVPNPCFYDRMCRLLAAYKDQKRVFSISAYSSIAGNAKDQIKADFFTSHRVFSWGYATWADRWHDIAMSTDKLYSNPFGAFYKIPPTIETQATIINQFWMEKQQKTDWVITMTLEALHQNRIHIIPKVSFAYNIGFGHPESKTYRGQEEAWVNAGYDPEACPNTLPPSLDLLDCLQAPLTGSQLIQRLGKQKGLWLSPSAALYLLQHYPGWSSWRSCLQLFTTRLPLLLKRWRSGQSI